MEGVTDAPMRAFLTELGGFSGCVSEFLRVSQEIPPEWIFLEHVPELQVDGGRTPSGVPVQVQLLGGDPERLAAAAVRAVKAGAPAVDLNFGCPAPTVNRHDGGATLLKHPERIRGIVAAVRSAVPSTIAVSAKLRLGWDDPVAIHRNAEMAAQGGASWITIHGRTRAQGYSGRADWLPIGEVRARLGIPVVANGDIWSLEEFRRCRELTGCEHFMLGRGALADPRLAAGIASELGVPCTGVSGPVGASKEGWTPLVRRFAEIATPHAGKPGFVLARVKQWLRIAAQRREISWFDAVKRAGSLEEVFAILGRPD